jgi:FkbM family methyltransferase
MFITRENFAIVQRDTHMGKWVRDHGRLDFDRSALNCYEKYFCDGDTFLNIGANIGCYAYPFVDKADKVICFEPHEECFRCLEYNIGRYDNAELYNFAVHSCKIPYSLQKDDNNIGASWVKTESEKPNNKLTCFIDQFDFNKINFILMDCEGFEYFVLQGAHHTIKKSRPIIVMEINHGALERQGVSFDNIISFLEEEHYTYRNIYKSQGMVGPQFDIICFPE